MKSAIPFVSTLLALSLGLTACGGSGDGFQWPGATGTALPYELMGKVDNAEKTEIRNGSYGSSMAPHPTREGYFYGLSDRGPNAATEAGRTPSGIIFLTPSYTPRIGLFRLTSEGKAELVDVVTAISSAEASLETVMSIRDQVISAYQEIMRMPI